MRTDPLMSRYRSLVSVTTVILLGATAVGCGKPKAAALPPKPATPGATIESGNTLVASDFDQRPASRIEELFIGRFPGVQVYSAEGGVQIRIRGATSINGSGEPLIVIDGQQMTPGSGGLVGINPRDIAKIEVLKDAVAMAEYGVRGGNGIIRITTKRGR
jgi:TonB-dependent SusC/RagA subfamily outer membrane receptor